MEQEAEQEMSQMLKPRPYQKLMANHILHHKRCALWVPMGMGKSASVLIALDSLRLVEDIFPTLIIAPLRVAQSTWPDEVAKWKNFEHFKVSAIVGDKDARMAALGKKADIYTTNYEQLPWLVGLYGKKWPFKTIIADESTRLKSFRVRQGGQRAKALGKVAHTHADRFIELTGTPSPNGLQDLHGQIWFLDQGERLGRTYTAFEQRWFTKDWNGFSSSPMPHAQSEIESKLSDICLSFEASDYFDLEKPILNKLYVKLPPRARKLYDDMEKRMFVELEGDNIEAFNAATKTMKCLQFANGAAYTNEDATEWKEIHNEKIKALESIVEEAAGMPILVAYHFRSDLDRLKRAFPSGRSLDKDPQTIKDWNAGKIPILFAHPASAGHGLSLQDGGNIIVFFSVNWNLEEHLQIIERIGPVRQKQSGYDRPVFIHYILAENTVDDMVLERIQTKRSVQDILMDAMKKPTE